MQHLRFQSPAQTRPAITPPPRQGHQGRWYHPRASWSKCLMFHNQRGNIMRYLRDKISRETQALAQGGQAPGGCDACALEHTPAEGPRSAVRDPDTTRAARTALGTRCQQLGEHSGRVTGGADAPDAGCQHVGTVSVLTGRHRKTLPKPPSNASAFIMGRNPAIPKEPHSPGGWREIHSLL